MSIPKIIHYCWFGDKNNQTELIKRCINSWGKLKGFEIIEWNENNVDLNSNYFLQKNYELKRYAFVSDYVRLKALYEVGGIYLDTDVEVKKPFDEELFNHSMFLSFMFDCNLSTGIIGAEKSNIVVKQLMDIYNNMEINDIPNNDYFTEFFLENFTEFKLNNKMQLLNNNIAIYPKEYFEFPTYRKDLGYSVHHFTGTWRKENTNLKEFIKRYVKLLLGEVLYAHLTHYKAIKKSPFYETYKLHINK